MIEVVVVMDESISFGPLGERMSPVRLSLASPRLGWADVADIRYEISCTLVPQLS